MRGVILAAGKGTRLRPLTYHMPKPVVPVLDRPMIEHIIKGAVSAGVDELALVVGYKSEMIREQIGDGSDMSAQITYLQQTEYAGTGDALLLAEEYLGDDPFFLSWGDIIVPPHNYTQIMSRYRQEDCDGVLTVNWMKDPYEGAAVYTENGYVSRIIEKPPKGTSDTHFNNAGIFVLPPQIFPALGEIPLSDRGELEAPDAIMHIIDGGLKLLAHEIEGYRYDVARPSALLDLNADMLQTLFDEAVVVADSAEVADTVEIEPPVYIGCGAAVGESRIGPNAVIGTDCRIGDGCRLQHTACFSGAVVGDGAATRYAIVNHGASVPPGHELAGSEDMPACLSAVRGEDVQ